MPLESMSLISPRLIALHHAIRAGAADALDAFLQEVRNQGAPLIEAIPNDSKHSWVTFLWRAEDELNNVVIVGDLAGWNFEAGEFDNLAGTNLWYKTYQLPNNLRTTYWLAPNDMLVPMEESIETIPWKERTATWRPDPLNPRIHVTAKHEEDPDAVDVVKSVLEMPNVSPQLWLEPRPDVPKGLVTLHRLRSNILDNERRVWVYTPPNYTSETETYNLLLLFDGQIYTTTIPTPTILDNLLTEMQIPSTVAVLIDSPNEQARNRELASYPPFADFLVQELLPWIHGNYHVTSNPERTTIGGSSHGGQGAAYIGVRHPEIFGNILAQSGSFWWKLEGGTAYEWLADRYITHDKPRPRFYLNMGTLESLSFFGQPTALEAVRSFRDILVANEYQVHYTEYSGGHDLLCWAHELASGLIKLARQQD